MTTSSLNLSHSLANIAAEKDKDKKSKDKKNKRRSLLDTTSKLLKGLELTASMGAGASTTLGDSKKEVEVSGPLHLVRLEEEKQKKRPNVPSTPRQVIHAGWLYSIKPKKRKRSKHNFPNKQRVPKKYWCRLEAPISLLFLSLFFSFLFLSLFVVSSSFISFSSFLFLGFSFSFCLSLALVLLFSLLSFSFSVT